MDFRKEAKAASDACVAACENRSSKAACKKASELSWTVYYLVDDCLPDTKQSWRGVAEYWAKCADAATSE